MASELRPVGFDYSVVPLDSRAKVEAATSRLHTLERRTSEAIIQIGKELIQVRADIGHGNFLPWLKSEFSWSEDTAQNFMRVSAKFANTENIGIYQPSALYALASPSTPEDIRIEFTELAQTGQRVTHQDVQNRIQESRRAEPIPVSDWEREPIDVDEETGEIRDPAPSHPQPKHEPKLPTRRYFSLPDDNAREAAILIRQNMFPETVEALIRHLNGRP